MDASNGLMAVKVLILVGAGAAFVWWQLRDVAKEKQRTAQREGRAENHQQ
jgi:ATP-dependent Clp protease adapter protein ClpS